mgnify:CR=1 FL=1
MTQPDPTLPYNELLRRAHALWALVDIIDSADDEAKHDDAAFRRMVMRRVGERHKFFYSDDDDRLLPTAMPPTELVIAEVDGGRSITLRGLTLPYANKDCRFDQPGDTWFEGAWRAAHMTSDNAPTIHGFELTERGDITPVLLLEAFYRLVRDAHLLKVTFGSTTRYGTLHVLQPTFTQIERCDWRMQFRWSEDVALSDALRERDRLRAQGPPAGAADPQVLVDRRVLARHADLVQGGCPSLAGQQVQPDEPAACGGISSGPT